jgi:hypothetical protein
MQMMRLAYAGALGAPFHEGCCDLALHSEPGFLVMLLKLNQFSYDILQLWIQYCTGTVLPRDGKVLEISMGAPGRTSFVDLPLVNIRFTCSSFN